MKKLVFVLMAVIAMTGCSVDSNYESVQYEVAKITSNDLPEEFIFGKNYEVSVTYELASECNSFAGIDARRAGTSSSERRNIYVAALSVFSSNNAGCDNTAPGNTGSSKFSIIIDEPDDYTFNFWIGKDENGDAEYEIITVPVTEESPGNSQE